MVICIAVQPTTVSLLDQIQVVNTREDRKSVYGLNYQQMLMFLILGLMEITLNMNSAQIEEFQQVVK